MSCSGITFEMSNGEILSIIPGEGARECTISNELYEITYSAISRTHSIRMVDRSIQEVIVVKATVEQFDPPRERPTEPSSVRPERACNVCNGRSCCVTNCCGRCAPNCPWICEN